MNQCTVVLFDIAGMDKANPLATILSVAMMFYYTFQMPEANLQIEKAVSSVLENYRTEDIKEDKKKTVGCKEIFGFKRVNAALSGFKTIETFEFTYLV